MSVADLVRRLQSRADTPPEARPDTCGTVRTVAPGANTGFQAVRTPEPAPMLAIRPVFAPVALFAPETVEVWESFGESVPAALFDEGQREAFDERAAHHERGGAAEKSETNTTGNRSPQHLHAQTGHMTTRRPSDRVAGHSTG